MKKSILLSLLLLSCGKPRIDHFKKSDHFDGEKFFLPTSKRKKKSFLKFLKWRFDTKNKKTWPEWEENKPFPLPKSTNKMSELSVTFINHATTLIQLDGVNILTDPIWSDRSSPVSWAGPKRVRKPGISLQNLPKIDVILISHNHYDHMDLPTLKKIVARDSSKILFGLGNSYYLSKELKPHAIELDWGQTHKVRHLTFNFLPSKHWSKRTFRDTNKSLWGAFTIIGTSKIYFAGDTGYSNHFKDASKLSGEFDLSLIPIGAYEPRWFMKGSHINPEESLKAHYDLKSKVSIAIHHNTFQLTDEGITEPADTLKQLMSKTENIPNFKVLKEGESLKIY